MKKYILDFFRKGIAACGLGPIVLVVFYLILYGQDTTQTLTVNEVCTGIVSLSVLAFIAGGMNTIHQVEQIPLMVSILIHGVVLYVGYLATYLVNGWLESEMIPILVFSAIFVVGYLIIWAIIYSVVKRNTDRLNEMLKKNQQTQKN